MELHSSNFILHGHQTVIGKLVIGDVVVRKVGSGRRGLGVEVSLTLQKVFAMELH